ncbi:MAG: hypothetical protein IPJ81_07045 [Chitinophagaceae bacterium]|nr:hypothetical protein [Chitinophagaceae bacterium]
MSFEKDYKNLLAYAGSVIKDKSLNIQAGDLINDAYIKFIENNNKYDKPNILKIIARLAFEQRESQVNFTHLDNKAEKNVIRENVCKCCKQLLPVTMFYMRKEKYGHFRMINQCNDCRNKKVKEYQEKNKQKLKENYISWFSKNKDIKRVNDRIYYHKIRKNKL